MITGILHPARVVEELVRQDVTHMVTLPDSETRHMYDRHGGILLSM